MPSLFVCYPVCVFLVVRLFSFVPWSTPPGWFSGEHVRLMTWWLLVSSVFLPLTSAEACEKSSQWLWKESCVSTGGRKPGNTLALKVVLNQNTTNNIVPRYRSSIRVKVKYQGHIFQKMAFVVVCYAKQVIVLPQQIKCLSRIYWIYVCWFGYKILLNFVTNSSYSFSAIVFKVCRYIGQVLKLCKIQF